MKRNDTDELLVVSHLRLRRILGILGVALPIVLVLWGFALAGWSLQFQDSISDYYSLRTRDAFVGILFVIAWFLATYKGYETIDDIIGYLACLFALGVAFFPNSGQSWERVVHFSSAAGLFLMLSFFSLFLFTKSADSAKGLRGTLSGFRFGIIRSDDTRMRRKKIRNRIYVTCGLIMLGCIVLTGLYSAFWKDSVISAIKPVLVLETLMIWAFGVSWFIKGETLWRDKKS